MMTVSEKTDFQDKSYCFAFGLLCLIPAFLLFSKAVADISVVLIGLTFLFRSAVQKDWRWLKERDVFCLALAWVAMVVIVSPFAVDPVHSIKASLAWLRFVVFYAAVTRWLLVETKALKIVSSAVLVTVTIAALDALFQLFVGHSLLTGQPMSGIRLTGPLDRPNIGIYLSKTGLAALALALAVRAGNGDGRYFKYGLIAAVIFLPMIFLTGERTASVLTLFAVVCALCGVAMMGRRGRLISAGLGGAVIVLIGCLVTFSDRIASRVAALGQVLEDYTHSIYGELVLQAWHYFLTSPITGIGMDGFESFCKVRVSQNLDEYCYPHPHNLYMEWLSNSGIIGTVFWLAFVALIVWQGLRLLAAGGHKSLFAGLYLGALSITLFPLAASQSAFSNWPAILAWMSISSAVAARRFIVKTPE